jgi:hypothetical protein
MTDKSKNWSDISEYNLYNPPPEGHPDIGQWVWRHFEASWNEKEKLGLRARWKSTYRLFRGNHWGALKNKKKNALSINLFFANVSRTVANITAKNPMISVVDLDGSQDHSDQVLSAHLKKWWHSTNQQGKLARTSIQNEIQGITTEKFFWNRGANRHPDSLLVDGYSFFPAPGYFENAQEMPYCCHAIAMDVERAEQLYEMDKNSIVAENVEDLLGTEERELVRPNATISGYQSSGSSVGGAHGQSGANSLGISGGRGQCLLIEMWFKDNSFIETDVPVLDDATGEPILDKKGKLVTEVVRQRRYPDGIRVVTVCNRGNHYLNDMENPNINWNLPTEQTNKTHAWGKVPFFWANSYEDTTSIWGFSAAEQTGDIIKKVDEIVSKMTSYIMRVMFPPLIVEAGCGITRSMINNKPNLVLMPTRPNADIRFIQVPNLPHDFFKILDILIGLHDRIHQIEDADRGVQPTGVTAASAIVALQERNSVLIQHKIRSVDQIAMQRGMWAISFFQNFGVNMESVEVKGTRVDFQGVSLCGRRYNYVVESGSTVARTSLQEEDQLKWLYDHQVIDRRAILEGLNVKNWKDILERVGEDQLGPAMQVLIDAGLSQEGAEHLKQYLMQKQSDLQEVEKQEMEAGAVGAAAEKDTAGVPA